MPVKKRGRKSGLTPRRERFAREYVVDLNAKAAAIRAGYSKKDAAREGCLLLKDRAVRALIDELKAKQYQRLELKADNVLLELSRIGFLDPAGVFNLDNVMLPIHEIPEDIRRCISSIEVEELWEGHREDRERVGNLVKVKFWNKNHALETLGKHFKLWVERLELGGRIDIAAALKKARERRLAGQPAPVAPS